MNKNKVTDLSSPEIWRDNEYIKIILDGVEKDGFASEVIKKIRSFMADKRVSSYQDFKNIILNVDIDDSGDSKNEIQRIIEHLDSIRQFNETCFLRDTPEKTRVIQWPNNRAIYKNAPEHYFDIFEDYFYKDTNSRFISKDTPIGSAGSCFALRISHQLQLWEYNYVIEEDDLPKDFPLSNLTRSSYRMSPARVGTLFNVPTMRQMIERAYGEWEPQKYICYYNDKIYDPFRNTSPKYNDIDSYLKDFDSHTKALKRALSKCEVFILTLGLTEAWQFANSGDYISVSPWKIEPSLLRAKHLSVEDNLNELERLYAVYKKNNPKVKLIISVSPVPLNKTFSTDSHIVVANMRSKSVLRVAAEEFCSNHPGQTFYFPSYEMVVNGTENPWEEDKRHVSPEAIERVMKLFQKMFLIDQTPLEIAKMPTQKKVKRNYGWLFLRKILRPVYHFINKRIKLTNEK